MSITQDRIIEALRRKALKAKTCPFCGLVPVFEFKISKTSSIGHYAVRRGCCKATSLGQTELFFHKTISLPTFKGMAYRLLADWNRRKESEQ